MIFGIDVETMQKRKLKDIAIHKNYFWKTYKQRRGELYIVKLPLGDYNVLFASEPSLEVFPAMLILSCRELTRRED